MKTEDVRQLEYKLLLNIIEQTDVASLRYTFI